ncbi:cation diffusion facilitator family transporter [Dokdonella sp.]|uniref:cation diffusion facilitator family transporter n=1 Tax=Dokdonella sp. TaxID=2291710 RepID=UPI001B17EDE2|nr:cation diffusion facilitator family transporter [Dokdonella sp.]MBO9662811.1 cation diffusion facilitator family transporter [Dokdonella sp.]
MSHTHHHAHDHAHDHASAGDRRARKLLFAFALTAITLVAEAIGGWLSGSLALLADAGHMLVDAAALMFAWLGAHFAQRPADARRSFGYARLEVLVGYSNALVQFVLVAWIVVEALLRLSEPQPILSGTMLVVAIAGLVVNAFVLFVLSGHDHDDLNTASARLHVLGDLFGSLGAVTAALLIGWLGWLWADPIVSILVSLLILASAWRLLRRSAHILLEGSPEGIDADRVGEALQREADGVRGVHHVHVWQLAGGYHVATLHAQLHEGADADQAIRSIHRVLREHFRIEHATVQIEAQPCAHDGCAQGRC